MSEQVTGVIAKIKENNTRVGVTYAFVLEGDSPWYSTYKTKIPALEGQTITFDASKKGNFWNADPESIKVVQADKSQPKSVREAAAKSQSSYDAKQASILYQSSRKDALVFMGFAFEQGALSLKSNTKQADKLGILQGMLEEITGDFYAAARAAEEPGYTGLQQPAFDADEPKDKEEGGLED